MTNRWHTATQRLIANIFPRVPKQSKEIMRPLSEPTADEGYMTKMKDLLLKMEELGKDVRCTRDKIKEIGDEIKDASLKDMLNKTRDPSPEIETLRQQSNELKETLTASIFHMKENVEEAHALASRIEEKKTQALFNVVLCHFSLMDVYFHEAVWHRNALNDTITNFSGNEGSNANGMPSLLSSTVISRPEAQLVNAKCEMEENAKNIGSLMEEIRLQVQIAGCTGTEMQNIASGILTSIKNLYALVADNAKYSSLYDGANVFVQGRQYATAKKDDVANSDEREIRKMLMEAEVFSKLGQLLDCWVEANKKSTGKDRVADSLINQHRKQLVAVSYIKQ